MVKPSIKTSDPTLESLGFDILLVPSFSFLPKWTWEAVVIVQIAEFLLLLGCSGHLGVNQQ